MKNQQNRTSNLIFLNNYYDKWLEIPLDKKHYLLAEVIIAKHSLLPEYIAVIISSYVEVMSSLWLVECRGGGGRGVADYESPRIVVCCRSQTITFNLYSVALWRYFSQINIVAKDHNIWEVTDTLFAAFGRHSSLWPKATTIERSQIRLDWQHWVKLGHHCNKEEIDTGYSQLLHWSHIIQQILGSQYKLIKC